MRPILCALAWALAPGGATALAQPPAEAPAAAPAAEPAPAPEPEPDPPIAILPGPDRVPVERVAAAEGGFTGLDRLPTATMGPLGTLRLRLGLAHFETRDFLAPGSVNVFTATDFALSGSPLSFAELAFSVRATSNANDQGVPRVLQSVGDATFGLKLGWTLFDTLSVAATGEVLLVGLVGGGGLAGDATSYRLRGILTGDFLRGFDLPLRLTLSLGFDAENREALVAGERQEVGVLQEWGLQIARYDRVMAGLALEVPLHRLGGAYVEYHIGTPLQVELTRRGPGSDDFTFDTVPHWVTPGIRAFPVPELAVDFALRWGLSDTVYTGVPATPPWVLSLGLTYTLDPRPEVTEREVVREVRPPAPAVVGGVVLDGATKAPIAGAVVEFVGAPDLSAQVTGADGRFSGYRLDRGGPLTVKATAEGYREATAEVQVAPGGEVQIPFTLAAAPPPAPGRVEVQVVGSDGEPMAGRVRLSSVGGPSGEAAAGRPFRAEVPPGRYVATVSAEGAAPVERPVDVVAGETATVRVTLEAAGPPARKSAKTPAKRTARAEPKAPAKRPAKARFPTIAFAEGSAALSASARRALDGVAATLARNARITRLRIAAHTDNRGDAAAQDRLSNERARAVRAYLIEKGVEARRLSARGFGATRPVAPNLTARGRARNNRVEFQVLGGSR